MINTLLVNGFSVLAVVSPAHKVWLYARGAPVRAAFPSSGIGVSALCLSRQRQVTAGWLGETAW
ncbi:hypothetical protein [Serratia fonticola]